MISNLYIENIAIIEKLEIEFSQGFTVLTGETGAGKSILIDSINTVLGERTSKDIIRTGQNSAYCSAMFTKLNNTVISKLNELDIEYENNSLLIERKLNVDGKTICKINSRPVSATIVRELSSLLINIHGQHDSQALLNSDAHYIFVDLLANNSELFNDYQLSYYSVRDKIKQLAAFKKELETIIQKKELYEFQVDEIASADVKLGESDNLKSRKETILNLNKIMTSLVNTHQYFIGVDDEIPGINAVISKAIKELGVAAKYINSLTSSHEKLVTIEYDLTDIVREIEQQISSLEFNPNELEEIELRLDLLNKLSIKYGKTEEDILKNFDVIKQKLDDINYSDESLLNMENELETEYFKLETLAKRLTNSRKSAATVFEKNVVTQLRELNMPSAEFSVQFTPVKINEQGAEQIEFLFSANKGESPKPLAKIASGGELSRVMLAIKSILSDKDEVHTLIFDEIDTGISGRAALSVGNKIKQLADGGKQIICVTHLAQIAALGEHHYIIKKEESSGSTSTTVEPLSYLKRVDEIARIIGGKNITENTLKSAEDMLKNEGETV